MIEQCSVEIRKESKKKSDLQIDISALTNSLETLTQEIESQKIDISKISEKLDAIDI